MRTFFQRAGRGGRGLAGVALAGVLALAWPGGVKAETGGFGPYAGRAIEAAKDKVQTAEALIRALLLDYHRPDSKPGLEDRFEVIENRLGGNGQTADVMVVRIVPKPGDAASLTQMVCSGATGAVEMQVHFWWDDVDTSWKVLDRRASGPGCDGDRMWTRGQMDDVIAPPHFLKLTPAERGAAHTPEAGTPERKAILDAVRAYNRDLNDRVPIVFVEVTLRVDDRFALFAGKARRKSDLAVLPQKVWGPCEQDPQDGVIEALLERKGASWVVIKGNRCADDVLFTEADQLRHRLLFMPD